MQEITLKSKKSGTEKPYQPPIFIANASNGICNFYVLYNCTYAIIPPLFEDSVEKMILQDYKR